MFAGGFILAAPTLLLLLLWMFFYFLSVFISHTARCTMSSSNAGAVQSEGIKAGGELNMWGDASEERVSLLRLPPTT